MTRAERVAALLAETLPCGHTVSPVGEHGAVVLYCRHPEHADLVRQALFMTAPAAEQGYVECPPGTVWAGGGR
jgi:hypothetical protein